MNKKTIVLIIFLGIAVILSGCGNNPSEEYDLEGTTWELFAFGKTSPLAGSTITLEFKNSDLNGTGGCNMYQGSYNLNGDLLSIGMLMSTEMACMEPEGLMEQEQQYLEYLSQAQRIEMQGPQLLIYYSDQETLTFNPMN
ncbi:MAG: META domain-containing protein [Anaerolineaceae bacterium]|nr:META domain-containing protein [Anaerolineaceae bacterium]